VAFADQAGPVRDRADRAGVVHEEGHQGDLARLDVVDGEPEALLDFSADVRDLDGLGRRRADGAFGGCGLEKRVNGLGGHGVLRVEGSRF